MELLEAVDQVAALEMLHEMGCTDGLPVIIPTTELVIPLKIRHHNQHLRLLYFW